MNYKTKRLVLSAFFMSLGMVLPLLTAQIKEIGDTLLPMHIPVMLCGLICGPTYGGIIGFMLPFFRSFIFGMPSLYPNAIWMALEMATYGFVIGALYVKNNNIFFLYFSLITAMLSGRIIWGITKSILIGLKGSEFTFKAFLIGGFIDAVPGIVLQLVFVPAVMIILKRLKLLRKREKE